jgi:hypothetical protein
MSFSKEHPGTCNEFVKLYNGKDGG